MLLRRGRKADRRLSVFWGETCQEGGRLFRAALDGLDDLLELDLGLELGSVGEPVGHPLLLVCTHGRRDPCCARHGRPLHEALRPHVAEGALWQSSHHGGHRFAANLLALPAGVQLGRVDPGEAADVAVALTSGRIPLHRYRGRTLFPPAVQAAEVVVRKRLGLDGVADLRLLSHQDGRVRFGTSGGEVEVRVSGAPGPQVPPSCGDEPEPTTRYDVRWQGERPPPAPD